MQVETIHKKNYSNKIAWIQAVIYSFAFIFFSLINTCAFAQKKYESTGNGRKKIKDSVYVIKFDTLLHVQSWISAHQMEYKLVYNKDFKLILAPNTLNNLSFGFSYRYLDLSFSFTPNFLNPAQQSDKKGKSQQVGFRTSFSMHRFNLGFDLNSVTGFYLKNSADFVTRSLPDSPFLVYPDLKIGYFSVLLRYNVNPKFSTAALGGGTQIQQRSAWTVLPSLQFATFNFHNDDSKNSGVQNESTYSTDLNLLFPVLGTLAISSKFSATLGIGPSIGVDFFKSVSLDDSSKVVTSKGTKLSSGYTWQAAISYHPGRFFAGFESKYRSYGHKIEDISRLVKQYSYFQVYIGWRLKAPRFAKKSLDWVNKISPVDLD